MKRILLIATGGTIASRPTAAGGLAPALTSAELLACVPELAEVCHIDALQLYNLDSTNIGPDQWIGMVHAVRDHYDAYDGFVITHGTDTMAYTAAALAYMIQRSAKPVVLTGSQKSIYNRDTDARNNLYRAVLYACHPAAWGVQLVFDGKVILGTRARKIRTKSFNAFPASITPTPPNSGTCAWCPSCRCRQGTARCCSRTGWTRRSLCCGWCRGCGPTSSRCWPATATP